MTKRLINETDEDIVIPSGEAVDVTAKEEIGKTTVSKIRRYKIRDVRPVSPGLEE